MLLLSVVFGHSQADTVVVPSAINGNSLGAINKFILGDTLLNGDRKNPERFYKLETDKIYFLNGEFHADFDLRLIADPADNTHKPPIIASTNGPDGQPQLIQFQLTGNAFIQNIMFQMTPPSGGGESNASFFLAGEGKNYYFDRCKWEWGLWEQIVTIVPVNKIVVTNCYFRNPQHKTNIYNGRGVGFNLENPADTVIMVNNTFFNINSFAFVADNGSIPPLYFRFDHNTIVNEMKWPIHSYWISNAHVTNNIFYNCHSFGETSEDKVGQDRDGLLYGLINAAPIPNNILARYGIMETARSYDVLNNAYFFTQDVLEYLKSYTLQTEPFMNSRTLEMFNNDSKYPNMNFTKLYYSNPKFIETGNGTKEMINWMKRKRNWQNNQYWGWDPDNNKFEVQWPFPENFKYTNDTLITGAQGGFPLGDLNWWPEKLAEWEIWTPSSFDEISYEILKDFSIQMIYPNPATNIINVEVNSLKQNNLNINLMDIDGSVISNIFNSSVSSGSNTLNIDISKLKLHSGNYILEFRTKLSRTSQVINIIK
jgi:hypothetical protein